jgi:hypothetical protein
MKIEGTLERLIEREMTTYRAYEQAGADHDDAYHRHVIEHGADKAGHVARAEAHMATRVLFERWFRAKTRWEMASHELRDFRTWVNVRNANTWEIRPEPKAGGND